MTRVSLMGPCWVSLMHSLGLTNGTQQGLTYGTPRKHSRTLRKSLSGKTSSYNVSPDSDLTVTDRQMDRWSEKSRRAAYGQRCEVAI